jgi:hypothetical protein
MVSRYLQFRQRSAWQNPLATPSYHGVIFDHTARHKIPETATLVSRQSAKSIPIGGLPTSRGYRREWHP